MEPPSGIGTAVENAAKGFQAVSVMRAKAPNAVRTIRCLNIDGQLADSNGRLREGMMNANQQLHPTVNGYQVWADALKPVFTELLGPPANEDPAPAPTGTPSAR